MCTHNQTWIDNRKAMLGAALGATVTSGENPSQPGDPFVEPVTFHTSKGDLSVSFYVWSPLTAKYKTPLAFDNPGVDPLTSNPYKRASLNRDLKMTLMNDCLVDAVVYSGRNGDAIRQDMIRTVCTTLGGEVSDANQCELNPSDDGAPIVFITESLGSKFLFDAIRTIWLEHQAKSPDSQLKLARRLAAIQMVFMAANQIPLLDQANPVEPIAAVGAEAREAAAQNASSFDAFVSILRSARARTGAEPRLKSEELSKGRTIVAFSDPNDLLSYRLLPAGLGVDDIRVINVIVSNDDTYLGYVERPDNAHCGYSWNKYVIGLIVNGYDGSKPLPEVDGQQSTSCLG
jgi:hypothetical protein